MFGSPRPAWSGMMQFVHQGDQARVMFYAHDWLEFQWQHMHLLNPDVCQWACTKTWSHPNHHFWSAPLVEGSHDHQIWAYGKWSERNCFMLRWLPCRNELPWPLDALDTWWKCWSWSMLPMRWFICWVARPLPEHFIVDAALNALMIAGFDENLEDQCGAHTRARDDWNTASAVAAMKACLCRS
jgi:hypothetical protein